MTLLGNLIWHPLKSNVDVFRICDAGTVPKSLIQTFICGSRGQGSELETPKLKPEVVRVLASAAENRYRSLWIQISYGLEELLLGVPSLRLICLLAESKRRVKNDLEGR